VHELLAEGLGQLPDGIGVIATSRAEPPPACAGLVAAGALTTLDGEAMRLALDETQAIAQRRGVDGDAAVQRLHARSNGWAAGLTLLLARPSQAAEAEADDAASLQHVFGYFAQRTFAGLSAEQQRMLMQLAFLPLCSADIAEQLTGRGDAGRLLERCHRRNLFIDRRRSGAVALYQFHALFRAFLQHQARAGMAARELQDLLARGAALLDAAGHWEQALAPYADAGDWLAYAR
jgi:ATP/maltotriose-dependent transcriptional regulator MalT